MPALAYSVSLKSIEAIFGARGFTPGALFSSGEQGAWYDPSDFSTMFQDAAGTTPVTAVEQPVGLVLDKSKGLAIGAELVTNGDFSNGTTGWLGASSPTLAVVSGELEVTRSATGWYAYQDFTTVVGKTYVLTGTVRPAATNSLAQSGRIALSSPIIVSVADSNGSTKQVKIIFTATGTSTQVALGVASAGAVGATGDKAYFDNISVRELAGNHASQSTAASRPVLSARVNLLTYTEDFSNAAWTKYFVAVPATKYADPYGGTTANLLYPTAATTDASLYRGGFVSVSKTHSYAVKAAGKSWLCILKEGTTGGAAWFNLSTGLVGTVAAGYTASDPVPLGNGWYRCSVTSTSGFSQYTAISAVDADNSTTPTPNGTDGIYIWGADLRPSNAGVGLPAYQRVGAATDYDASGFPYYLRADGADDRLIGPAISNLISASAYEACVGARALAVSTSSASPWLNQTLVADGGGYVGIGYMTTSNIIGAYNYDGNADTVTQSMTPPSTFVLQQRHDGGNLVLSLNGGAEASAASGNTSVLTGEARVFSSNSSPSVQAHLYGLVIRSTAFTAAERASIRDWMNSKTKAY